MTKESRTTRILVVDDEDYPRDTLVQILRDARYEADSASSGEQALEMLRAKEYPVVLLDVVMRGPDGWDVLKEMRRIAPHSKAIMVTRLFDIQLATYAIREGASEYLVKGMSETWNNLLIANVERALQGYRMKRLERDLLQVAEDIGKEEPNAALTLRKIAQLLHPFLGDLHCSVFFLSGKEDDFFELQMCMKSDGTPIAIAGENKRTIDAGMFGIKGCEYEPAFASGNGLQEDSLLSAISRQDSEMVRSSVTRVALPAIYAGKVTGVVVLYVKAEEENCRKCCAEMENPLRIFGIVLHLLHIHAKAVWALRQYLAQAVLHAVSAYFAPLTDSVSQGKRDLSLSILDRMRKSLGMVRNTIRASEAPNKQPCNLYDIVSDTLLYLPSCAGNTEIRSDNRVSKTGLNLLADSELLLIALGAIRDNSVAAITERALKEALGYSGLITITARQEKGRICLSICDNGVGVKAPEFLFQRHSTKPEGMGIGLMIAKTIVEQHDGDVCYDRDYRDGAKFDIYLPLSSQPARNEPAASPQP